MTLILFNPQANNRDITAALEGVRAYAAGPDTVEKDLTQVDVREEICALSEHDRVLILGGDGTIMRIANALDGVAYTVPMYLWKSGTGNDFLRDIGKNEESEPVLLNPYLTGLPHVEVKGNTYLYINGIGFGIDGYCCEVGDRLKAESKKPNYTAIAIKGLLFHYKPTNATITVDGKSYSYKKVWIAAAMKGRFYGGGMMTAPDRNRESGKDDVTLVVMYGKGKLKTLMVFPTIFKGEHVNHKEMVAVHTGKEISVTFDRPTALQIDGETVLAVTNYKVTAGVSADINAAQPATV
jgi:diacylglycerol kinase family enzyme